MIESETILKVLINTTLNNSEKLLLIYLILTSTAGQTNETNKSIADNIRISKINVNKGLETLHNEGLIHRELAINKSIKGSIERRITILKSD